MRFFLPGFILGAFLLVGTTSCRDNTDERVKPPPAPSLSGIIVECPVCGLKFDRSRARATAKYKETRYYFLLDDHRQTFESDPETYLKK